MVFQRLARRKLHTNAAFLSQNLSSARPVVLGVSLLSGLWLYRQNYQPVAAIGGDQAFSSERKYHVVHLKNLVAREEVASLTTPSQTLHKSLFNRLRDAVASVDREHFHKLDMKHPQDISMQLQRADGDVARVRATSKTGRVFTIDVILRSTTKRATKGDAFVSLVNN
eukprot:CAMPEP_0184487908 /NCGR_PEP_ID=MMETSP0113_2-20130426/10406_1 /TAXON_ID=91329 /ORGANISM="Norrisiella sphaerica, Strain BC52" /LENGTH=167 /DNA_ID=CAMNT_0026870341 /DNA_START=81 /DNA_END=584 /DNA_ORIENTATION=+